MAILSDATILRYIDQGLLKIAPFSSDSLSPSGYDLRAGRDIEIQKGSQTLVHTLERVELPPSIAGELFIRSSFAREGLFGSFAFVDPGFKGQLTISIANLGLKEIMISKGERFVQIVFNELDMPSSRPYSGKYQDSKGVVDSKRFSIDM
ncbi:MAG: dCTP deaminase [Candidatus Verstraetearchaeota archaeon]|nr:dCTP deaminase [Candidatus Verstraetearchaeota archaeon]